MMSYAEMHAALFWWSAKSDQMFKKTFPIELRICFPLSLMPVGLVSKRVTLHTHLFSSVPSSLFSKLALDSPTSPHSRGEGNVAELQRQPQASVCGCPRGQKEGPLVEVWRRKNTEETFSGAWSVV